MITINFTQNTNNDSLQIGDIAYFISTSSLGGFNQSTDEPIFIGPITNITQDSITVDNFNPGAQTNVSNVPSPNDFIMFSKDSSINISGLTGYYAEVEIKNNSDKEAEMYCIASEITARSK